MKIDLICVGRLKEKFYIEACAEYEKRMRKLWPVTVTELQEEPPHPDALKREAAKILAAVPKGAYLITFCIEGKMMSSTDLATKLSGLPEEGFSRICLVIGSSEGLHESVKAASRLRLSMSPMTFPHHLARVMALEQLYRAASISSGGKYHK